MTVVKKEAPSSSIIKKVAKKALSVSSTRNPSQMEEMGDVDFGDLDANKDGYIVSYDSVTDKFVLITADQLLAIAAEDTNIDETFIDAIESELDLGSVAVSTIDGGVF